MLGPVIKNLFSKLTIPFGSQGYEDFFPDAAVIEGILRISFNRERSPAVPDFRWVVESI
jgi:hypothetical protein